MNLAKVPRKAGAAAWQSARRQVVACNQSKDTAGAAWERCAGGRHQRMKHLLQFQLEDGSPVYVEVEAYGEAAEAQRLGRGETAIEQAESRFSEAINRIRPAAEAVLQTLRELNTPDEIGLEFGVKFNAKAGAILASVDSEATFKVSLKWTNKR